MTIRIPLVTALAALAIAACSDDNVTPPPGDPDLVVSGRLLNDLGQPLSGGLVSAWIVDIPSTLRTGPAWMAPSCDNAQVPAASPGDDSNTRADGTFDLGLTGLAGPMCLLITAREPGQSEDAAVLLPPRLVSPGVATPVIIALGDIVIGRLDLGMD